MLRLKIVKFRAGVQEWGIPTNEIADIAVLDARGFDRGLGFWDIMVRPFLCS